MTYTGEDGLKQAILGAIEPAWGEIVRSKKAILEIVADGAAHGINELQRCLFDAEDVPFDVELRNVKIVAPGDDAIASVASRTNPVLGHFRLAYAASEAVVDLIALGVLVGVNKAPVHATAHSIVRELTIPYQYRNRGSGVPPERPLPNFDPAYRLAPHLAHDGVRWFADPDVFAADLDALQLDPQTKRCITEALAAYRNGLYLSAANMLGAASEGAWYAAGERLRHLETSLAKALNDNNTTKVVKVVADKLRNIGTIRSSVRELEAQAALLTELRNYGIHPRGNDTAHLERYFTEAGAAMLLMETYTYLIRLGEAVDARNALGD